MNVNVSVLQIPQSGYCLGVADALAAEGYPAAALCLEVVESMLADAAAGGRARRQSASLACRWRSTTSVSASRRCLICAGCRWTRSNWTAASWKISRAIRAVRTLSGR